MRFIVSHVWTIHKCKEYMYELFTSAKSRVSSNTKKTYTNKMGCIIIGCFMWDMILVIRVRYYMQYSCMHVSQIMAVDCMTLRADTSVSLDVYCVVDLYPLFCLNTAWMIDQMAMMKSCSGWQTWRDLDDHLSKIGEEKSNSWLYETGEYAALVLLNSCGSELVGPCHSFILTLIICT